MPTCCCPDETTTQLPGPKGDTGNDGSNGTNGVNAFTLTTDSFVQPAVDANVTVPVEDSTWMGAGQVIWIDGGGYYEVQSKPDGISVILKNLGYTSNVAPGTTVVVTSQVSPGGLKGVDGADGVDIAFPGGTLGDLIVNIGGNTWSTLSVPDGANGKRLKANNAVAGGMEYDKVDLGSSDEVEGVTSIANGGTGQVAKEASFDALSPVSAEGDLIYQDATAHNVRLVRGSSGQVLMSTASTIAWGSLYTGSGLQTINKAAVDFIATFAHGLAAKPSFVRAVIVCITNDNGYTAAKADEVEITSISGPSITVTADDTNVLILYHGSDNWGLQAKDGSGPFVADKDKWKFKMYYAR